MNDSIETGKTAQAADVTASSLTMESRLRLDPTVGVAVLEQESMLLDPVTGAPYLLDGPGTLVITCLDGVSPLREIAADIAAALEADPDQVATDIMELARVLGGRGLLEGVARDRTAAAYSRPEGLPVGAAAGVIEGHDLDGEVVTNASLVGFNVLVNWSTTCGYCSLVRDELAALSLEALSLGIGMWLVTTADNDALREQVQGTALRVIVAVPRPTLFEGFGTPSAYVLNDLDQVAEPVAAGAFDVPAMIRRVLASGD